MNSSSGRYQHPKVKERSTPTRGTRPFDWSLTTGMASGFRSLSGNHPPLCELRPIPSFCLPHREVDKKWTFLPLWELSGHNQNQAQSSPENLASIRVTAHSRPLSGNVYPRFPARQNTKKVDIRAPQNPASQNRRQTPSGSAVSNSLPLWSLLGLIVAPHQARASLSKSHSVSPNSLAISLNSRTSASVKRIPPAASDRLRKLASIWPGSIAPSLP